jgi:hypothetical protein
MQNIRSTGCGRLLPSRSAVRKLFLAASSSAILLGIAPLTSSASAASAPAVKAIVQPGGMVRSGSPTKLPSLSAAYPSCHAVTYRGNAGYISVQEKNNVLAWGITMTPFKYSIGRWNVSTYLSGKKTTSGFNRTVTVGYRPHGSLKVPSGKVFHVQAKVVGPYGTFVNVPNACRT